MTNRHITLLATAILFAMILAPSVSAQQYGEEGNVMMANRLLLRLRCPVSGYTIAERADAVQRRLNELIIPGGINLNTVRIKVTGNTTAIYAAGTLLVTVSECDARANNTTVSSLARQWVARFKMLYPQVIPPEHGQSPPAG
ncbi:MAG: hypothetical protein ACYC64_12370 [Armatimonadota bacterium]